MTLAEIESEFGFAYTEIYKQLERDGMLDVGEYGPNWYTTVFPKLKDNPTLFLHTYDFELLSTKAVNEAIKELSDPDDHRRIKPSLRFIPFGQSGAGDHYCFFLTEQDGDNIPIVFVWHDDNRADYLAKNLQDYIFRVTLTDMSDQDVDGDVSDESFRSNLKNILKTHAKYLTKQQAEVLQNVFMRKVSDYEVELPRGRKETHRGLLRDTELNKILMEVIPYEKMGNTFKYSD